jgi:hypothetical protein
VIVEPALLSAMTRAPASRSMIAMISARSPATGCPQSVGWPPSIVAARPANRRPFVRLAAPAWWTLAGSIRPQLARLVVLRELDGALDACALSDEPAPSGWAIRRIGSVTRG